MNVTSWRLLIISAAVLAISACATPGSRTDPDPGGNDAGQEASSRGVVIDGVTGERVDPNSIAGRAPKDRVIYFDYDNSDIRPEYLNIVASHGRYLAQNADARVRLEGHTDERGTREYNIALGERRSKSVERMLRLQGVATGQTRSLSYGEELPVDERHMPEAWEKNRRVIIVYETN